MTTTYSNYERFITDRFDIIDKEGNQVPFVLNKIQKKFVQEDASGTDVILKARQQGFTSIILAIFTTDFLMKENSRSVIVADIDDNATELLDRVKSFLRFYEEKVKVKIPLKYNSRNELYNEANHSRYTIGTAKNVDFGRSKTITNLHLSEFAFYPDSERLLTGAVQAVVPNGRKIIETTANGFNSFKTFWDSSVLGERDFKPLFYPASDFYDENFLNSKRRELGRMYSQEYPETALEAFVTTGETYFDKDSLQNYLKSVKKHVPAL